jgi:uncharacterized protein YeaO (DUF488 family)
MRPGAIDRAERIVADELPDIPIWQGYRFRGAVIDGGRVCVDRLPPRGADTGPSHVVVSTRGTTGEPQDGLCKDRERTAARLAEATLRFYERMDDDAGEAVRLITELQAGRASARRELLRLHRRIVLRINAQLARGGDTSVAANTIMSATFNAAEADPADRAELERQLQEVVEGRRLLAAERV